MITTDELPDQLDNILMKKSKWDLITIMYEALDLMQQYNGRSKLYCIMIALGYKAVELDNGGYKYIKGE